MKKIIELIDVSVSYQNNIVLENINFSLYENDFIGVIGPNGGGKTSLIKAIIGELKPIKGQIKYFFGSGEDNTSVSNQIGYLPQIHNFDKKFPISVKEVVMSGFASRNNLLKSLTKKEKKTAVDFMQEMGVFPYRNKPIGELSGGQMQRVLLCRAIVSMPRVLLLDEPNTFVDNKFEKELYDMLLSLNKNMAIVLVSHDLGMISSYVKKIACVNKNFHLHNSNVITKEQLENYNCPIQLITHGEVPHTVLEKHIH